MVRGVEMKEEDFNGYKFPLEFLSGKCLQREKESK